MKILGPIFGLSILTSHAFAAIPVGRGEVSFDISASATYDTNVTGGRNGPDDYRGTLSPHANYARRAGLLEADANLSLSSNRYVDQTQFDSDDVQADVTLKLSEKAHANFSGSFGASYSENFTVNRDINARIKSKTAAANGQALFVTGPRTRFGGRGSYSKSLQSGASDQEMWMGGVNFDYSDFLDRTALNLKYDYTETHSSGDNLLGVDLDQNSHLFSAGLSRPLYQDVTGRVSYGYRILNRSAAETATGVTQDNGTVLSASVEGPFLPPRMFPKIQSRFSISYEDAATPGINDTGTKQISGNLGLSWLARPNTTVSFDANRAQRLSITDFTVVSTTVQLRLNQKLRYNLDGMLGAGYNWETFKGVARSDEILSFDASLNYSFARNWRAGATYRFQDTKSSVRVADYKHGIVSVTLNYRF